MMVFTDLQKKDGLRKDFALFEDILRSLSRDNVRSEDAIFLIKRRMEPIRMALED